MASVLDEMRFKVRIFHPSICKTCFFLISGSQGQLSLGEEPGPAATCFVLLVVVVEVFIIFFLFFDSSLDVVVFDCMYDALLYQVKLS